MDLNLFHDQDRPDLDYYETDRTNGRKGAICYLLEWSCWYDRTVALRLLGHYRLFHLCKSTLETRYAGLPPENSYIRYYREKRILKNSWVVLLPFRKIFVNIDRNPEIKSINHTLLFKRPDILHNFLVAAETDFDRALLDAIEQISDPVFLSETPHTNIHYQITEHHQHNTSLSKNELHIHPHIKEEALPQKPTKGKEEGVFSKKQMLILLDLLATAKIIEPIDLKKSNKFPAIAELLRAITGRTEDTWQDELDKYRNKGLYYWESKGQKDELIRILTNLADKFGDAGIDKIALLADKKIRELRRGAP